MYKCTDKFGDTWCETNDEKQVKATTTHPQRRTPLDKVETNQRRQVKRHIQRAGDLQPDWETNEGRHFEKDIRRTGQR